MIAAVVFGGLGVLFLAFLAAAYKFIGAPEEDRLTAVHDAGVSRREREQEIDPWHPYRQAVVPVAGTAGRANGWDRVSGQWSVAELAGWDKAP